MEIIQFLIDFVLHIDEHLAEIVSRYGTLTYVILFAIIFCETGLVVTPFLPGDTLLFTAGAVAAITPEINITYMIILLLIASILGNTVNYLVGRFFGARILEQEKVPFIKKQYVEKTKIFYEKHGGKAIVLGRFLPIIRTFVPFVAGIGQMNQFRFYFFNVFGACLWVIPISLIGFYFGQHPFVKKHFSVIVLVVLVISVIPAVVGFGKEIIASRKTKPA